jgi:trehalose-6-phosphate synthase
MGLFWLPLTTLTGRQMMPLCVGDDDGRTKARMQRMCKLVKEQKIYRWAGNLIADLCGVRIVYAHDSNESLIGRAAMQSS